MRIKITAIVATVLCMTMAPSAMVIHNYCKEKEGVRSESGIFNEDYLFLGHELTFSGEAEDLLFLGKRLTFTGKTKLGLIALCEKLIFSGTSGNGIIAGGWDIVVDGKITGNNFIGCKTVVLSEGTVVKGTVFAGCARMRIDGKINGDLYAGAGELVINNTVEGNVTAMGGRIVFGEKGKIHGNLTYGTKEKLSEADAVKVSGAITVDESLKNDKDWKSFVEFFKNMGNIMCFVLFFSCIIVGCLLLFLPIFKKLDAPQSEKTFWNTSLWGLIPMLMYPALIVLCCILIIPIPMAIVLALAFFPLVYISYTIGTTLIGKYLVMKLKWNVQKRHYQFLIGALAGAILSIIPFVNFLFMLFVISLGWGMYVSFLFNKDLTHGNAKKEKTA